jgi:hypothetical protein
LRRHSAQHRAALPLLLSPEPLSPSLRARAPAGSECYGGCAPSRIGRPTGGLSPPPRASRGTGRPRYRVVLTRSGFDGAAPPPRHLPDQTASSFAALVRQEQRRRSSTATQFVSALERTRAEAEGIDRRRQDS